MLKRWESKQCKIYRAKNVKDQIMFDEIRLLGHRIHGKKAVVIFITY